MTGWSWWALGLTVASRAYRAFLLTLAAIGFAPLAFGWASHVIQSGSMEPTISVGDVVVAGDVGPTDRIAVGRVYVFDDPAVSGRRQLVHRIVERRDDGTFTTAGDANEVTDSTALDRGGVRARALLLVPYVGLPVVWATTGAWGKLAGWLLLTVAAFVLAGRRLPEEPPDEASGQAPREQVGTPRPSRRAVLLRALGASGVGLVVALAVVHVTGTTAEAAFVARTTNGSSTWQAAASVQPYVGAVLADSPQLLWLLDEEAGPWAADRSGNGNTGSYYDVTGYRRAGGLANNFGYAVDLVGAGRVVDDGAAVASPSSYTLELWVRTASTTGGRLLGFESSRDATSAVSDRTLHMNPRGQIVFGAWDAPGQKTVVTPASYNDDAWHHVAVVAAQRGSLGSATVYVDGAAVASGNTSKTQDYTGWWRAGSGVAPVGPTAPTTSGFDGLVDNVAVYHAQLADTRVAAHYAAR